MVVNVGSPNRLFLNNGDGHFVDSLTEVGDQGRFGFTQGLNFGDVDGDGDLDLILTDYLRSSRLFLNDGKGRYTYSERFAPYFGQSVGFGDVDGDGDLDAYVNTFGYPPIAFPSQQS